jgi:starch synthase
VASALPKALARLGISVTTLVPGYPAVLAGVGSARDVVHVEDFFGGAARLLEAQADGQNLLVIDAPHLFDRPGNPYVAPDGSDWPDNAGRFGALAFMAARIGTGELPNWRPDIIHGHDWQAALTFAHLAYSGRERPKTVLTVHNLAFQGQFPAHLLPALRLPHEAYTTEGVEYYGGIGFLKAGLQFADRITTVSPTYAQEIQTSANGYGLEGLLRHRASVLCGILNGIDVTVWDPATDPRIVARYDRSSTEARRLNKQELQKRFGLPHDPDRILFGAVTRLSWQKGVDLLAESAATFPDIGAQLAILGAGDRELEQRMRSLAAHHPNTIACKIGYDEDLAHMIQAGADALVVPSRFEPCGLTQLCALRYGAIPVVSKVGGLEDTIIDLDEKRPEAAGPTGIKFGPVTADALAGALRRAVALLRDRPRAAAVQQNAMATDVSWSGPARRYAQIYADLLAMKG